MQVQQESTKKVSPSSKLPFQIDEMLNLIEKSVRPYPKAMLSELYDRAMFKRRLRKKRK